MDCHDARLLLTLQRREPEQLDRAELEAIERHVELCPGCQTWNQSEARFETALTAAVKDVPLPAGLKDKIASGLSRSRPPRRMPWLGAAAVLLAMGVGAGTYLWWQPIVVDDPAEVVIHDDQGARPDDVQAYFAALGHAMTPPPQFEYDYLLAYKLERFKGRLAPRLTFQCRRDNGVVVRAYVFCLPNGQFRLSSDFEAHATSQFRVFHGDRETYIAYCTGGDLGLLLRGTF
jgi:hypothetical protein